MLRMRIGRLTMMFTSRKCRLGLFEKFLWTVTGIAFLHVTFNVFYPAAPTLVSAYHGGEMFLETTTTKIQNPDPEHNESIDVLKAFVTLEWHYDANQSDPNLKAKVNVNVTGDKAIYTEGLDLDLKNLTKVPIEGRIALDFLDTWKRKHGEFLLRADDNPYIIQIGNLTCLREGTDIKSTFMNMYPTVCVCLPAWTGRHCSVPNMVSALNPKKYFTLRDKPRRIIQTFLYNGEWEMLCYRLHETGDLVHAFIIQDAVYTGYGDPKNVSLIPFLLNSSLPEHVKRKVIPKVMFTYPSKAAQQGWPYEVAMRNHAFRNGLPVELRHISDDDILLHTDADEVPSRESLLFLKLHDRVPEPVCFNMQKTVFGFYWYSGEWHMHGGATFRMMKAVYHLQPNLLRSKGHLPKSKALINAYVKETGALIGPLIIGNSQHPSGFHCSWCGVPEAIRNKLMSAINADFPRWGDYPMKCELSYIKSLIAKGQWFTDDTCFKVRDHTQEHYAPNYMLQNPQVFKHLLHNPYNHTKCVENKRKGKDYGLFLKNWHRMSKSEFLLHMNKSHISPVPDNLLAVLKH